MGETSGQCCAYIALLGAPNAGKSTLLNTLTGSKVSIVTPKAQTTRSRILGICTEGDAQLIFIDTPGIFSARQKFERAMVKSAWSGAADADTILLLVDAGGGIDRDTKNIMKGLAERKQKAVLVLNKIDVVKKPALLALAAELNESGLFSDTFMISALQGDGVKDLKTFLKKLAPAGHWLFPADQMTDISERLWAAEITREQIFMRLQQELPYVCAVETEKWEERKNGDIAIHQVVYVQKEGHKKILLGKGGQMLKAISSAARKTMEPHLLGDAKPKGKNAKRPPAVHLFLFVKVRENWKDDPAMYAMLGLEQEK